MEKDVAFLEEKVRCVIEPMINGVFKDNPEDPVKYMIRYLNHYIGISNEKSTEKEELINYITGSVKNANDVVIPDKYKKDEDVAMALAKTNGGQLFKMD